MGTVINLEGQTFGSLTVVKGVRNDRHGKALWLCRCDCGNTTTVVSNNLRKGNTTSCGCRRAEGAREATRTHGEGYDSPEYRAWKLMKQRCTNPNDKNYAHYGGRGITVCERWNRSFEAFLADMGRKPSPRHSIDRIDNEKGYSPENCRWANHREQARNTRANHWITLDGRTLLLTDWSEITGIRVTTILNRLGRGWTVERTLTTPAVPQNRSLTFDGQTLTTVAWSKIVGLKPGTINKRISMGWTVQQALTIPFGPGKRRRH